MGGAVSVASTVVASAAGGEEKAGEEKETEGETAGEATEEEKTTEAPVTVVKPFTIKPACKWVVTKEGKWAKAEVAAAKAEGKAEGNKAKAACTVA